MASLPGVAGELDSSVWKFSGANAADMKKAVDNDLGSCWESGCPQTQGVSVTIDLGQSVSVYRVFLTSGRELPKCPRSLNIYVGETPESLRLVAEEATRTKPDTGSGELKALGNESFFRFPPEKGRYVKLEIGANGSGMPWAIAEMDIHAAAKSPGEGKGISVVLDGDFLKTKDGKPASFNILKLAAEELQYYLMELTDTSVAIVPSDDAKSAGGLRFRLVTPPAEQVPSPEPDPANLEDVSIKKEGDEVVISGPTRRAVLYGAYEFLNSQGVRWLFADANGDLVPARKELDLSVLPISYRPPFSTRGLINPELHGMPVEQFSLFQVRHRYNMLPPGTVPRMNCGFGWAHTMGMLFEGQEKAHPEWWPGPYRNGWYKVPCLSNPEVLELIVQKMENTLKERIEKKLPPLQGFGVHPNDSPCFCECPNCEKAFGKPPKVDPDGAEDSNGTYNYSDRHFNMINALAERLKKSHPELFLKTLAYANHELAPKSFDKMPDNVLIDICPWWKPLPVSAPQNASMRDNIKAWSTKCKSLGIWSYVLIYSDTCFGMPAGEKNLVVPNVRAILDQNKFYKDVGIRQVSTQLSGPQKHWPWGLYAFARSTWYPEEKPEAVLGDFFRGYYGEAWEPMLKWYEALEKTALEKHINTEVIDPRLFEGGNIEKARNCLAEAQKLAKRWYVKERISLAAYDTEWTYERSQWKTKSNDRPYPCYRVKEAPAIDGKIDDAVWKTLPEMQGFRIVATRIDTARPGWFALTRPTSFRMGWDDKSLYLAMKCVEPDIENVKVADAKQKAFEYRNAIEIFHAPEIPPYYRQTMIDSAGNPWGPMKIKQINSHQPLNNPDFACKTAYEKDAWTLEARFPLAMLADTPPKEGTAWPANLVHPCTTASDGEEYSSWSDIPRMQFHQFDLGSWSIIDFMGSAPANVAELEKKMNAEFLKASQEFVEHKKALAEFAEKIRGKENLLASKENFESSAGVGQPQYGGRTIRYFEITLKKPVELDAVRISWNRKVLWPWFTLEYWDGGQYRFLDERRNNSYATTTHLFNPVTTSRIRMTVWPETGGWETGAVVVKAIEAYGNK
jgi:hypothetical protein